MSPDRMMHKSIVNVVTVLFDLGLYGGGVVGNFINPVELFDLRHFSCAMVFQMGLYMLCDVIEFVFPLLVLLFMWSVSVMLL